MQVLEVSSTLNVVARKVFLMLFGCPRQNENHSSENLKVIYIKRSMFCANKRQVKQNSSSLKVLLGWTGNVHFCTICEIVFLVGGP